ncbi:MAG TPA: hypothetical protein VFO21_16860 [Vicinamibacterales bacterium]|nr:hypothetical protein [Vicinamibacterales bacterium]
MSLAIQRAVIGCFCIGVLAAVGCTDGSLPVSPSAGPGASSLAASFPRSGDLDVTKECSTYTGHAGDVCTITSSNVEEIEVGSTIVYARDADFSTLSLDSDVVLDPPGPGNNTAFGHCNLSLVTGIGLCTFSGGTGKFTHFHGSANVSYLGGPNYAWDGTYSFGPRD